MYEYFNRWQNFSCGLIQLNKNVKNLHFFFIWILGAAIQNLTTVKVFAPYEIYYMTIEVKLIGRLKVN
jgi:hypothetical protein